VTAQTVKHANVEQIVNMYFMRLPLSVPASRFTDSKRALLNNQQNTLLRRQINVNAVRQGFGIP
jgi:hypothetical protein